MTKTTKNPITPEEIIDINLRPYLNALKGDAFNPRNISTALNHVISEYWHDRRGNSKDPKLSLSDIQDDGTLKLFSIKAEHEQIFTNREFGQKTHKNEVILYFTLNKETRDGFLLSRGDGPESIKLISDKGRDYLETLGHAFNQLNIGETMNDVAYIATHKKGYTFHKADGTRILGDYWTSKEGLTSSMAQTIGAGGGTPSTDIMDVIDQKGYIHVFSDSNKSLWFKDTRTESGLKPFLLHELGLGFRQGEVTDRLGLNQHHSKIEFQGAEWDPNTDTIKWVFRGQYHGNGRTSDNGVWEFNTGDNGIVTTKAYQRKGASFERTTGTSDSRNMGLGFSGDGVNLGGGYSHSTYEELTEVNPDPNELEEVEFDIPAGTMLSTHKFIKQGSHEYYNLEKLLNKDLEVIGDGWVGGRAPGASAYYPGPSGEGRKAKERNEIEPHGSAHLYEVNDSPWGRNELGHIDYSSADRVNEWWAEVEVEDSDNARAVLDFNGENINPRSNEYGQMVAATQTELTTMESDKSIWREENCDLVTGEAVLIAFKNDEGTLDIGEFKSTLNGLQLDRWAFQGVDQSHDKFSRIETHFQMDLDPILGSEANGYTDNFDPSDWDLTQIVHSERPFPGGWANWGFRYSAYRPAATAVPPTNQEPWECDFASNTSSTPLDNFDTDRTQTAGF